jgi:hypothetical protein
VSDTVPIGTQPGSISALIDEDLVLSSAATAAYQISKLFLRTTDSTTDAVVASIRNATGGGGDGLACTIADAANDGVSTGSAIDVDVGEKVYLRLTSGNSARRNLSGWFEREGATASVVSYLTTISRLKTMLGIAVSTWDAELNQLIDSVSVEIQNYLGRQIIQTTATSEKLTALQGDSIICTRHRPIISIASISEAGTALVEDTGYEITEQDKERGQIVRLSGGYPTAWSSSHRRIEITYDHGFTSVPSPITQAATELAAFDFLQSKSGDGRLALRSSVADPGGSGEYRAREELWAAQKTRLDSYARME